MPYFEFDPNLKVRILCSRILFIFDSRSQAYFKKTETYFASNEERTVKTGDMVVIKTLARSERKYADVDHTVQVVNESSLVCQDLRFFPNRKQSSSWEI